MLMAISQRQSAWAETPRTIHRTMRWLLALLPMGLDSSQGPAPRITSSLSTEDYLREITERDWSV
ncbi:hypothetical protein CO661_31825 [Sinorhizobium fredii]|uniref:Uncharacterized protein n=1 Tax=Rhizobium fredii TaxID=380 RepID=A0A2A6LP39_RHIFR|nr:hypothetical protein CO661_31825 [Sinorhizobium fredii]UTY47697.1 hypothetical protein EPK84_13315 [Sinorhizobium fredii]